MECIFRTDCKDYLSKDGETVELIGPCDPKTYDKHEVGRMYDIRFKDGETLNVFVDELELPPALAAARYETVLQALSAGVPGWRLAGCRYGNVSLEADVPGGGTYGLDLFVPSIRGFSCQLYDMLDCFDFIEWEDDMQGVPEERMAEAGEWLKTELRRLIVLFIGLDGGTETGFCA